MPALFSEEGSLSPFHISHFEAIVTTYDCVTDESTRIREFTQRMDDCRAGKADSPLPRPHVTLLTAVWTMSGVGGLGKYLVLLSMRGEVDA